MKFHDLTGEVRLAFHPEVLRDAHVFRLAFHGGVFCDSVFCSAVERAGIISSRQSLGLWFYGVAADERWRMGIQVPRRSKPRSGV